ncbi:MAG: hypothetical protein HUU50_19485 [Candidatus Brocadiae bacterium]|nr:hypothetical protein [Candidatus Brocadiia bacterium]
MHFIFCIFLYIFLPFLFLSAQQDCNQILINGVFDNEVLLQDQNFNYAMSDYVSTLDYGQYQKTMGASASVPTEVGNLSGGWNQSQFEEWKKKYLSSKTETLSSSQSISMFKSKASETIVKAWSDCMNRYGLFSYIKEISKESASFSIIWKPIPGDKNLPMVQNITIRGGKVNNFKKGQKIKEGQNIFALDRTNTQDLFLVVTTTRGDLEEYLPFWKAPVVTAKEIIHKDNLNPLTEGWAYRGKSEKADETPVEDELKAWEIKDYGTTDAQGGIRQYHYPLTQDLLNKATKSGWKLSIRVKIVEPKDQLDYSIFCRYSKGNWSWTMCFGIKEGKAAVGLQSGQKGEKLITHKVPSGPNNYHLYELVYDPNTKQCSVYIDGTNYGTYAGWNDDLPPHVAWGASDNTATGRGRYNLVKWEILK